MVNFLVGDSRFFWPENIKYLAHLPFAWDSSLNTGIGIPDANTLWITSYLNLTASLSRIGFPWDLITIIFWIIPILLVSFFSAFFLFRNLINKQIVYSILAGIIFSTNTYFLSIFLGGQLGVSFAYAFIPLVLLAFINLLNKPSFYLSIILGLLFSIQVLFDPRFAFLTAAGFVLIYLLFLKFNIKDLVFIVVIPVAIVILLHSFWILPVILFRSNIIPKGFDSVLGVKFFSFAFFENSISLLHPNWPENIFGKTYFMRPEFLIIPIIAFVSLLFFQGEKREKKKVILFFALLALISAFLAKGFNEPFGILFALLFEHIPGFGLFRDPTKFYSLIALSYAILIPYSLFKIGEFLKGKIDKKIITLLFIVFWLFGLRLLFASNIFQVHKVPQSYVQLKDFIVNQHQFFRTLWIPQWQRYGFFSDKNPAIGRGEIFKEASATGMIRELKNDKFENVLQNLSVKYVIVPYDNVGEIFVEDRKYDEKGYLMTISEIRKIKYLKEQQVFGKIHIFQVSNPKDHFWSEKSELVAGYKFVNPTKYQVDIQNAKSGDMLVFSEGYDGNWVASTSEFGIQSSEFKGLLNSFILPQDGNYTLDVYYEPQKWVHGGLVISGLSFIVLILILIKLRKK